MASLIARYPRLQSLLIVVIAAATIILALPLLGLTITDVFSIAIILIVVLALNFMAGYAGIPNFGMALFVYIGAFALAGVGTRVALALVELTSPGFIELLRSSYPLILGDSSSFEVFVRVAGDPMVNRIVTRKVESVIEASSILSLTLTLAVFGFAIIAGALTGVLASLAAVRLREDYLAIVLLAFSELMVSVVFDQTDALAGGPNGAWVVRPWPRVGALEGLAGLLGTIPDVLISLAVGLAVLAACFIYVERMANSPMGRMLRAMRDDDLTIRVYGRDVAVTRLKVMAIGAAMASIAGAIYATVYIQVKAADTYDRVTWTFVPWAMMILGGMANNWGAVLGGIIVYLGRKAIYYYAPAIASVISPILGVEASIAGDILRAQLPNILVGVLIILVLYLRPQGIIPEKPSKTLSRREIEAIT
ncbi:MAG: branched-chain amino acid ABC transporter permease [Thermoprotei archaeon]|nr:branched-chain amino acid ABC transporter permease [Thermoprotei archaeon]